MWQRIIKRAFSSLQKCSLEAQNNATNLWKKLTFVRWNKDTERVRKYDAHNNLANKKQQKM